jgi:hypothetical protein
MKKAVKEDLELQLNTMLLAFDGGSFRFRRRGDRTDCNGYFDPNTLEMVVSTAAAPATFAHELAHLEQFLTRGDTDCMNPPLCGEHSRLQKKWEGILNDTGVSKKIRGCIQ